VKIISELQDNELVSIIRNINCCEESLVKALRTTLYSLTYKRYVILNEISLEEINLINNYKNKSEFNNLFRLVASKSYSINDMYLKSINFPISF
jgi:hypothetical protein